MGDTLWSRIGLRGSCVIVCLTSNILIDLSLIRLWRGGRLSLLELLTMCRSMDFGMR